MTSKEKSYSNPMWGGHFAKGPAEIMQQINASIDIDKRMFMQDIRGSLAHVKMLEKNNIISADECAQIISGLQQIEGEISRGEMQWNNALEDIHMHIESRLKEIIGDVAGKLHTARSRNDQVATDFRLWIRDHIDLLDQEIENLQQAILQQAKEHAETIMPGFTHLQTAQPVTFGHHLMAYFEMFKRDRARLADARARMNESPLGSAALAGTSYPIDRHYTAQELEFEHGPTKNSLDSVSSRDFALEFLSALSIHSTHLSRLAEEIVVWMSAGFRFVNLSDSFTTGSSIMPQKRNPDAAELVRAKVGAIVGNFISLLTVMKGLPLAYSKDMQEDKAPVFRAVDGMMLVIPAMAGMIADMKINQENMYKAASDGYSTATDIADWLVQNHNIPFRECHHITGRIVRLAEQKECKLNELSLAEMQSIEPRINDDIYNVLSPEASAMSRTSFGGTAPENVKKIIAEYE